MSFEIETLADSDKPSDYSNNSANHAFQKSSWEL